MDHQPADFDGYWKPTSAWSAENRRREKEARCAHPFAVSGGERGWMCLDCGASVDAAGRQVVRFVYSE